MEIKHLRVFDKIYGWVYRYFKIKYRLKEPAEYKSKKIINGNLSKQEQFNSNKSRHILDEVGGYLAWLYNENSDGRVVRLKTIIKLGSFKNYEEAVAYLSSGINRYLLDKEKEMKEKAKMETTFDDFTEIMMERPVKMLNQHMSIKYAYARVYHSLKVSQACQEIQDIRNLCKGTGFTPMQVVEELVYPLYDGSYETPYELRRNVLSHFKKLVKREYDLRYCENGNWKRITPEASKRDKDLLYKLPEPKR